MKGLYTRTELEYLSPREAGMTLEERRGGSTLRPYTVVSDTRGDIFDFTSRAEAETFIFKMELEDRERGEYCEGRYTIRENPQPSRKELVSQAMRILGSSRSELKAAAVRENGKKGGRPRKK